jgi:plasmid maintenance system antidote protein VapI
MAKKKGTNAEKSPLIEVLKSKIRDCGLSLNELARRTGVSDPQLSRFLRGERTISLPAAEKLMVYFGMRVTTPDAAAKS